MTEIPDPAFMRDPGSHPAPKMNELSRQAVRIYRRYQSEIVEALHLCPWAEPSRRRGRVSEVVILASDPTVERILEALDELSSRSELEVGLLLFPRLNRSRTEFERFVAGVVRDDAARREHGACPFALAAFHPEAEPDLSDPERLIPFVRRTPDPTIQAVRIAALEKVREGFNEGTQFVDIHLLAASGLTAEDTMPLRERIARSNQRTILRVGIEELERRFAAIREDRNASYARLEHRTG